MPKVSPYVFFFLVATSALADDELPVEKKAPTAWVYGGEFASGYLVGLAAMAAGGWIGYSLGGDDDLYNGFGLLLGGVAGYTLGVPLGIHLVGKVTDHPGSPLTACFGNLLLEAVIFIPVVSVENRGAFIALLAIPPVGTTLFYNFHLEGIHNFGGLHFSQINGPQLSPVYNARNREWGMRADLLTARF